MRIYRHVKYFKHMNLTIYMRELNSVHRADLKYMGKYFICDRLLQNYYVYEPHIRLSCTKYTKLIVCKLNSPI